MIPADIRTRIQLAQLKWPELQVMTAEDGHVVWMEREGDEAHVYFYLCTCSVNSAGRPNNCKHREEYYYQFVYEPDPDYGFFDDNFASNDYNDED